MRQKFLQTASIQAPDDQPLQVNIPDISGGINTRMTDDRIADNQSTLLYNVNLDVPGQRTKRLGYATAGNDVGNTATVQLHNYVIQGEDDQLLMFENTTLWKWVGSGNWAAVKADFTAATQVSITQGKESGLTPDDVVIVQDGTNNAFRIDTDGNEQDLGDTNTSPPLTRIMTWYNNRFWALKNDLLYFSDAYDSDYSGAFDRTTNAFRIPVGREMGLIPTRDSGIVVFGEEQVWALLPSLTPAPTSDQPQPFLTNVGCVAENTIAQVGDDIIWLSQDGVRSLKRTIQDKLQIGEGFPLSYGMKDAFDSINWAYIDKACAINFDNKYILALPTTNIYNDQIWVYSPATQGWSIYTGINASCFAKFKIDGEEGLYFGDATDGKVYELFSGKNDNTTDIAYTEQTKAHNMGYPLNYKFGGEITLRCKDSGGTVTVYYQIDDNGWVKLGTLNTAGSAVTFPTIFPVVFYQDAIIEGKFHLDSIGERWKKIEFKFYETSSDDFGILDYSIVSYLDAYETE